MDYVQAVFRQMLTVGNRCALGPLNVLKNHSIAELCNRTVHEFEAIIYNNDRAVRTFNIINERNPSNKVWKPLTIRELNAFFGCLIYIEAMRDGYCLRTLWSIHVGHDFLLASMMVYSFEMILKLTRFHDSISRRS